MNRETVLIARKISKAFPAREGGLVTVVSEVSMFIDTGETLALVGESGSGKTTVGLMVAGLLAPTTGTTRLFGDVDPYGLSKKNARLLRRRVQWIPQMPSSSLNPESTVQTTLEEPLLAHRLVSNRRQAKQKSNELLVGVGLDLGLLERQTREMSIGQQQRLAIARALALNPELLVCDEITSGLDACLQVQTLNLILDFQNRHGLALLFITHDLSVARWVANRAAVMREGRIVEEGLISEIMTTPTHPYTKALVQAAQAGAL